MKNCLIETACLGLDLRSRRAAEPTPLGSWWGIGENVRMSCLNRILLS